MNMLDIFYRALNDYRKNTKDERACLVQRNTIQAANIQDDIIKVIKNNVEIDTDWIEAIEAGLEPIAKAIAEERQFIRSNGEVVPIEKAKRVSKDSVSHLARHSNLVTRIVDDENIIPDQIYTVEKLSDYTVYENRFLYMALCYFRDFIGLRFDKILEAINTYYADMSMNKTIKLHNQNMTFEIKMTDERKSDEYLRRINEGNEIIKRIDIIQKSILMYLNTPLMQEVSKAPMLKTPITKTNVLKMNNNFKAVVSLFEYISRYDKPGYVINPELTVISPFGNDQSDEYAEVIALTSFLTYKYSNNIQKELKKAYEEEEERRRQEESRKQQEQLKFLKRKIKESGMGMEEYMLMLENRNKQLEKESAQLLVAKKEIEELKGTITKLNQVIDELNNTIEEKTEIILQKEIEIEEMKLKHEAEIRELISNYEEQLRVQKEEYELKISQLIADYEQQIEELISNYEEQLRVQKEEYELKISQLIADFEEKLRLQNEECESKINNIIADYETKIMEIKNSNAKVVSNYKNELENLNLLVGEMTKEVTLANDEVGLYKDEKLMLLGQLNALRSKYGLIAVDEDFTTKERFTELFNEYKAFKKLFSKEWQKTKKRIYAEVKAAHKIEKQK